MPNVNKLIKNIQSADTYTKLSNLKGQLNETKKGLRGKDNEILRLNTAYHNQYKKIVAESQRA